MNMVISCLTVYVIALSSVLLLGKSYATTTPVSIDVSPRQNHRRGTKIHFQNHVKTNASLDITEASKTDQKLTEARGKHSERPKVLQSSFVPSNVLNAEKLSEGGSALHVNPKRSYFALFDPVLNVTKEVEVSGNNLPSDIRYSDFYRIQKSKPSDGNPEQVLEENLHTDDVKNGVQNFIEWDILQDSEKEVRIHYNGITAKETVVKTGVDEETGKRQGLKLRQLTDGTHFIQLIYNFDDEIQDCEYIKEKNVIERFLKSFRGSVENAQKFYREKSENEDDDYMEEDEGKIEKYFSNEGSEQYEGENLYSERDYQNVTFQIIRTDENLPGELTEWMNYSKLKRNCRENHKILKQLAFDRKHGDNLAKKLAEEHIERMKRSLDFYLIFPGTKWCGKSHIAEKYTSLGGFSKTDKCCRTHDHCHPLISAFEEKYGFYNFRPFTISHCRCDLSLVFFCDFFKNGCGLSYESCGSRSGITDVGSNVKSFVTQCCTFERRKRDIMDMLLVPGTKWCGKGRRATKYTSLGGFSRTDKCCRVHDTMCPHWIGSLEEKYGLFNWRINTIMHCRCDKRFRACLKMAKTGTANFVGKLFFNVVQTKCFVLKPQEVCLKYSWWGKCEKKEYRKKAYLKDNLSY